MFKFKFFNILLLERFDQLTAVKERKVATAR